MNQVAQLMNAASFGATNAREGALCASTVEYIIHAKGGDREMSDIKVHRIDSDVLAYDLTQCSDDIRDGDVLITQNAAAIVVSAWPILVRGESDQFHRLAPAMTWERLDHDEPGRVSYFEAATIADAEFQRNLG